MAANIFPVLNFNYAVQIAKDWNTQDEGSGFAGFVTQFEIPEDYFLQFEVRNVGSFTHNELWIQANQLNDFNDKIINSIKVIASFYGERFTSEKLN